MPTGTIILLGAFAGLTIYLGLPIARLKGMPQSLTAFLSMLATGVLIFLLYDMINKASEPIIAALDQARTQASGAGGAMPMLLVDLFLLVSGLGIGLIGLVYFNKYFISRFKSSAGRLNGNTPTASPAAVAPAPLAFASAVAQGSSATQARVIQPPANIVSTVTSVPGVEAGSGTAPKTLALIIATGIGLHNFSEGLAIGQSAVSGALQLATVLIIGFGLHNMTEGFGIAGPLAGQEVSWKFIALAGLIGGGPTFLGTIAGIVVNSPQVFIFCLALAAGAIIYVVVELLGTAKRFKSQDIAMWGLLAGFLLGYGTDLVVTFAGA